MAKKKYIFYILEKRIEENRIKLFGALGGTRCWCGILCGYCLMMFDVMMCLSCSILFFELGRRA